MSAMPETNFDQRGKLSSPSSAIRPSDLQTANLSMVMVVCSSPINRIVVSRIVEQSGLKVICEAPEPAIKSISLQLPGLVILDCGAANDECHALAPIIVAHRQAAGANLPMLIVLSTQNLSPDSPFANIADAVVAKPITPERLQPTIERLLEEARG